MLFPVFGKNYYPDRLPARNGFIAFEENGKKDPPSSDKEKNPNTTFIKEVTEIIRTGKPDQGHSVPSFPKPPQN